MTKLLFVSRLFPNAANPNAAAYNRQLLSALVAQGIEVRAIAPVPWYARHGIPDRETVAGIPTEHPTLFYPPGFLRRTHAHGYRWSVRGCFKRLTAEWRPDHVMLGFLWPDAVALAEMCRISGLAWSVRVNGSDFRARIRQPFFREQVLKTLQAAPHVFCPSQTLKRDMVAAGIEANKIVAFDNGVDPDLFFAPPPDPGTGRPPQRTGILYVGHLKVGKGVDRLIRAWSRLPEPEQRALGGLTLVGAGPDRKRLDRLARQSGGSGTIVFKGECRHDKVAEAMRSARVLCLPSKSEGMPNVVLEALACGCPVVATDVGEIPWMICEGETGLVVKTADRTEEQVTAILAEALTRAGRQAWDERVIADSVRDCTWEQAAETVRAALEGRRG